LDGSEGDEYLGGEMKVEHPPLCQTRPDFSSQLAAAAGDYGGYHRACALQDA